MMAVSILDIILFIVETKFKNLAKAPQGIMNVLLKHNFWLYKAIC